MPMKSYHTSIRHIVRVSGLWLLLLVLVGPGSGSLRILGAQEPAATEPDETDATAAEPNETDAISVEPEEFEPVAEEPEEAEAVAPPAAARKVLMGKIDGEIGLSESAYVKRLVAEAEAKEADVLLIELNTFGGRVDAAVAIRDALMDAPQHTAVFINRRAISAGALISLACNSIAIASGGTIGAATPIVSAPGQEMPAPVEEKYLSYFREEMRATAEANGRDGDIAEAMVDSDKEVPEVSEKGKLLTLNTRTALQYYIVDVEAESAEDALEKLGLAGTVETLDRTWSESLVAFLTSQTVASLLFLAMMVLAYLEYQSPGFGLFGGGAVVCLLVLYFGHYMVNLAGWEEFLLLGLGIALVLVELLVIPGFGVVGILGLVCMGISLVMLLMAGDWSDFTVTNPFTIEAVARIVITAVLGLVTMGLMVRYLPKSDTGLIGRRLVLGAGLKTDAGYRSHATAEDDLVGQTGTVLTPLRPSGKARIGGRRRNVETEGDFIAKGEQIRVLRREPGRIVVRRA
ncbi:MAG: nodulation protein NfeD [bacterium]|nr:nodulation protein NfeD [bacterium]